MLVGGYVTSPLCWGVSAHPHSPITKLSDLSLIYSNQVKLRIGISRIGSGSHTLGFLLAKEYNLPKDSIEFVILNNFVGLREGIFFLFDHQMTSCHDLL